MMKISLNTSIFAVVTMALSVLAETPNREKLIGEFDATFSNSLKNPANYSAQVKSQCASFPEGYLAPYTLVANAWCHMIFQTPGISQTKLPLIEKALDLALSSAARQIKPPEGDFGKVTSMNQQGSYLSQLGVALAAYRLAGGSRKDLVVAEQQISKLVTAELAKQKGAPLPSYPGVIRPLNTALALLAANLHDRVNGSQSAASLLTAHQQWIREKGLDPTTQLPGSRILENGKVTSARGSDLAWRIGVWSELDFAQSKQWYLKYRDIYWKKLIGAQGFREWSSNQLGSPDSYSGPILAGIGSTATLMGPSASQALRDPNLTEQILTQAQNLSKSRKSKDILSKILAKGTDGALKKGGIEPVPGFLTGFLYGDAMAFYAFSWYDYPDKPITP